MAHYCKVSIHARTRRATMQPLQTVMMSLFQSTHAHGVRHGNVTIEAVDLLFQSTHAHGVRPDKNFEWHIIVRFQSTHAHGVRPSCLCYLYFINKFQSTHAHGVRLYRAKFQLPRRCFNPRTHTACDSIYFNSFY